MFKFKLFKNLTYKIPPKILLATKKNSAKYDIASKFHTNLPFKKIALSSSLLVSMLAKVKIMNKTKKILVDVFIPIFWVNQKKIFNAPV